MTWARLAFRLQRASIAFAAVVSLGLTALAAWLTLSLSSMLEECASPTASHDCGAVTLFGSPLGDPALLLSLGIGVAMYAVPLVLGVPVLATEIERRTAMIAWPLAGSRLKWLLWRAGSVMVIGVVLAGAMAVGAEALTRANHPGGDPGFASHGARGISMVLRSTLMLVLAVALGAVIGRLLPSLLVGVALAVGLAIALDALPPYGVVPAELTAAETSGANPLTTGAGYRALTAGRSAKTRPMPWARPHSRSTAPSFHPTRSCRTACRMASPARATSRSSPASPRCSSWQPS